MTPSEVRSFQERMVTLLLINVIVAFVGPMLFTIFDGAVDYLIAFAAGLVVLSLAYRRYGRAIFWSIVFLVYLLWEIIVANVNLAWLILQPKPDIHPAIVAVPLRVTTGLEITMIATAITLTPATLSLDLKIDPKGNATLYVHALRVKDADAMRAGIRDGFERLILRIMRGSD